MKWLTSNLYVVTVAGAVLLVGSFVRFRLAWPNQIAFWAGAGLLLVALLGLAVVVLSPPGQIDTIDEKDHVGPKPKVPWSAIERLQLTWDSNSIADWPASETLAEISEIAYQPPFEAEKRFHALGFPKVMPVVQGSMIGYVVSGENVTVVVFRGTDFNEVSDWLANLGRSAIDTPHGAAHKGFYNAYQSMKSQVGAILDERDTTHLWVTGHSLGGAIALVCAYDLVESDKRQLDGLITFGQPMVARQELANYLDTLLVGRYARFVNRDDVVPKVPPSHAACGSLVWFTDAGIRRSKVRQLLYGAPCTASPSVGGEPTVGAKDDADVKPLTEAEFEALQAKLKAANAAKERLPEGTPMTYQAAPSLLDDHYMWHYLEKVRTLLGLDATKTVQ